MFRSVTRPNMNFENKHEDMIMSVSIATWKNGQIDVTDEN